MSGILCGLCLAGQPWPWLFLQGSLLHGLRDALPALMYESARVQPVSAHERAEKTLPSAALRPKGIE